MLARNRAGLRSVAVTALGLTLWLGLTAGPASADAGFRQWVAGFRAVAAKSGVSGTTYDRAFRGVTDPDPEVLEKARTQPEFTAPVWDYFDNRVHEQSVTVGQQMARKWKPWLDRIEQRYGVDRDILLAIWSMESNYGDTLKNPKAMRSVVRSLATLAYGDPARAKFARTQLIAALKILQSGDIDESHLTGSWAGAMGHTQFIPTSYQALRRRRRRQRPPRHLEFGAGRAGDRCQSVAQERLAAGQDLGLRGDLAGRQAAGRQPEPCQVAEPRRCPRQRHGRSGTCPTKRCSRCPTGAAAPPS